MMNKNTKWFLALGVATVITANGIVMAAVTPAQQDSDRTAKSECRQGRGHGAHKAYRAHHQELLALLKIDGETLRTERQAGKSLAVIAREHGVSEAELKNFMIKGMTERLDAGVKAGRLTSEQAEKMKTDMDKRVSDMINGKAPMHKGMRDGHRQGHRQGYRHVDNTKLLELLSIDKETLRSERKAGKSLATIAQERGVSEQALKDTLMTQMQQRIDKGVEAGKISADKAAEMKANLEKRIEDKINRTASMKR